MEISLRPVIPQDIAIFWANQLINRPQECTPEQQTAFEIRWRRLLDDADAPIRTIVAGEQVVGYIAHFHRKDVPEVCYELGQPHWGRGFATAALAQFLGDIAVRPLYARALKDNTASIRVLQKCGFSIVGEDRFTDASRCEREEFILELR